MNRRLRILIAHQSTIPPYRVPFYEALERQRPDRWSFTVIYDPNVSRGLNLDEIDPESVHFPVTCTRTFSLHLAGNRVLFQSFILNLRQYDLIIVENALNNLSYPLVFLYRLMGKRIISWGHGRDLDVAKPTGLKKVSENVKIWLTRKADGFFAYTEGVKVYMIDMGFDPNRVFTLNNTIDAAAQRRIFERYAGRKAELRARAGLEGRKVLLYVGRFHSRKRLDLLSEAFTRLYTQDQAYKLILVGSGDVSIVKKLQDSLGDKAVDYRGSITDKEVLGPIYIQADLFVLPGWVGLAPIQALCYNLVPVVIDSETHGPEFEYLTEGNALILPRNTTSTDYASAVDGLLSNEERHKALRQQAWPSIKHLTIQNMADQFIRGIEVVLAH